MVTNHNDHLLKKLFNRMTGISGDHIHHTISVTGLYDPYTNKARNFADMKAHTVDKNELVQGNNILYSMST